MVLTTAALKGGPRAALDRPRGRWLHPTISSTFITAGLRRRQAGPGCRGGGARQL